MASGWTTSGCSRRTSMTRRSRSRLRARPTRAGVMPPWRGAELRDLAVEPTSGVGIEERHELERIGRRRPERTGEDRGREVARELGQVERRAVLWRPHEDGDVALVQAVERELLEHPGAPEAFAVDEQGEHPLGPAEEVAKCIELRRTAAEDRVALVLRAPPRELVPDALPPGWAGSAGDPAERCARRTARGGPNRGSPARRGPQLNAAVRAFAMATTSGSPDTIVSPNRRVNSRQVRSVIRPLMPMTIGAPARTSASASGALSRVPARTYRSAPGEPPVWQALRTTMPG